MQSKQARRAVLAHPREGVNGVVKIDPVRPPLLYLPSRDWLEVLLCWCASPKGKGTVDGAGLIKFFST